MPGSRKSDGEDIPLPTLSSPRTHDFAPRSRTTGDLPDFAHIDTDHHTRKDTLDGSDTDSTVGSSSDFDWDAEDDARSTKHQENAKRGRAIWRAFMKLSRPIRTLLVAIIGSGILITPLLVFQFCFKDYPGHEQAHAWSLWLAITWVASCVTYLVVDAAPVLALGIFKLFSHQVQRMQITVELTKAVLPWLKLALDVSWAWIALSVIRSVYHPPGGYWVIINRVMQALFSFTLLLLVEKVFLHFVAINFHSQALADRIAENQLGLRALDRLSNTTPSVSRRSPYTTESGKRGHRSSTNQSLTLSAPLSAQPSSSTSSPIGEKEEAVYTEKRAKEKKVASQKPRRKGMSVIVDNLGDAIGQVALKNQGRTGENGTVYSASKLARKLFSNLGNRSRSHLTVEDFYPYFKSTVDAQASFAVFDKDGNGDITKKEMREAVRRIYKERKALTSGLKDVDSALGKLDAVLLFVVLLIMVFICLLVFNRNNTFASLLPVATMIVGFSFIFGNAASTLFESLIFIFSTHVFDVGDLVWVGDQIMFVKEFGLFSTTFTRVDGQEVVAPNSLLSKNVQIHNLRRSGSTWETTSLQISYDTPLHLVEQLRLRLEAYVKQNNREWSNVNVQIDKMEYQNAIFLNVNMEHRANWQDWGGRWQRRTAFMRNLKTILEDLDIKYVKPRQPIVMPDQAFMGGPRSPYLSSPRMPTTRMHAQGSRETLGMYDASREDLGNAGTFSQNQMSRAPGFRIDM